MFNHMKKDIINDLSNDLHIYKYKGETDDNFYSRLIYSCMCEWIRYCIYDRTNEEYCERKSKQYIAKRCGTIMSSLLQLFPECLGYFYGDKVTRKDDPISILRTKMIENGELIDTDEGIYLPNELIDSISGDYSRVLGISNEKIISTGITKLIIRKNSNVNNIYSLIGENYDQYVINLKRRLKWKSIVSTNSLEIFNPKLKYAPNKCWADISALDNNVLFIGRERTSEYAYVYYWVIKRADNIYIADVNNSYLQYKEIRRFILWQRQKYENSSKAKYEILGGYVRLQLFAAIPEREQRLLDIYGWPVNSISNKMEYIIDLKVWDEIKNVITKLCFELEEV